MWLLLPAARGRRPRRPGWLIAAFVAINLAAFAVIGAWWFGAGMNVAIAAVYLPLRWSVPTVAALAAAPAVMAAAGYDVELGQFFAQSTVVGALVMGPSFWLVRIAARLRAGRRELAGSAMVAERVRIDSELGITLGAELQRLIAAGERAARAAGDDPSVAERELRELTAASRQALVRTRRMVSRYQAITVQSELSTAVALLAAAGVPASVDVPSAVLDQALDIERLAGFRSGLTSVLRNDADRACVITIGGSDNDVRLEIHREHRVPS